MVGRQFQPNILRKEAVEGVAFAISAEHFHRLT